MIIPKDMSIEATIISIIKKAVKLQTLFEMQS